MVRKRDRHLIRVQNVILFPSLYICLHYGNEIRGFILGFCEVLSDGMHCSALSETHRFCKTMDSKFFGLHHLIPERWKQLACLSAYHPVGELDTLLSHLKNDPIQLWVNVSKNTLLAWVKFVHGPVHFVGHVIITCIHIIHFLSNLSQQW
jgi:hypothetical protein